MVNVAIRKLAGTDNEYLAYAKTFAGRGTYFVYFQDNIWGAMALHNFVDMLRAVFDLLRQPPSETVVQDNSVSGISRETKAE